MCPIENFGVVPALTRVTLSFSPGFAVISVTLNFIVSLPVISIARPSCTGVAGVAAGAPDAGAAELVVGRSVAAGAEHPAADVASSRMNDIKYRGI